MRPFLHPRPDEITLQAVLHALAEPDRLALFSRLCRGEHVRSAEPIAVSCTDCAPTDMPKSSLSRHFQILREAGLVQSRRQGSMVVNRPRIEELDKRFPGLLPAIFMAAAIDTPPEPVL